MAPIRIHCRSVSDRVFKSLGFQLRRYADRCYVHKRLGFQLCRYADLGYVHKRLGFRLRKYADLSYEENDASVFGSSYFPKFSI